MAQDGIKQPQYAQSPAVAALKYHAGAGPEPHKVVMERSFSQDMHESTKELKLAAEQTRNVILDLGIDGKIRWCSPSWTDVVGVGLEQVKGTPIADHIEGDKTVFARAIEKLMTNDSKSQFVKFTIMTTPNSALGPLLESHISPIDLNDSDEKPGGDQRVPLALEGQGIMVWDRITESASHTMWMLQTPAERVHIEVELPQVLVEMLGVGAEILAKYLSEIAEDGSDNPKDHPQPKNEICRICEREIVPWWFERHSDLCIQEHKAEMDVQLLQESLTEHRHAIVKVLDAIDMRNGRPGPAEADHPLNPPEYKGLAIGPSPMSSVASSSHGSQAGSPQRSRSPSANEQGHTRTRSSFIVRRPLVRVVELILDLCDTAIEISSPATRNSKPNSTDESRSQSPKSESRIHSVMHWQQPSSLDNEPGLAQLSYDTEQLARAKIEAVHRYQVILEYSERIRQEYLAEVDACITEALEKARRAAAGEPMSSSEEESENEEAGIPCVDTVEPVIESMRRASPAPSTSSVGDIQTSSTGNGLERARSVSRGPRSLAAALREPIQMPPITFPTDLRRPPSQAASTGSSSPQECPTPRSIRSTLSQPIPIHQRRSIYLGNDENQGGEGSLPPTDGTMTAQRTASPLPVTELGLSRSGSLRDRKRRSMHLHGLSSASSPHRSHSPGHNPPQPASPLRAPKGRLPSAETSVPSPIVSPLLTSGEYPPSPQYNPHHHRRQSSMHSSDPRAPLSPRLNTMQHQQPKAQAPSIKDFEIIKPISKGAFGSVYLSKKKLTGEYFAIKVLRKTDMVAKNQVTNVKAERAIMMWQGESDFVAKLYWTFSSKDYLFLVMEYFGGGDCASLVKVLGNLSEDWAKTYVAEVILGVEHLHSRGIVHRDLKPDNLLIDSKGHLKVTDFGLSRMGLIGRQKRALKQPEELDPDHFRQGNFSSQISGPASRSASFDYPRNGQEPSPGQTPLMTPFLAGGLDQPSYFALNRESSLSRDWSRRASGLRSEAGSVSSSDLLSSFANLGVNDNMQEAKGSRPISMYGRPQRSIEEECESRGSASPELAALSHSVSNLSYAPSSYTSQMLPPPTALFDSEETGKRFVGTPDYLAPETILGTTQDEMCDWWSLGCILFEFLYGIPPFHADTTEQVFDNILHRRIAWPEHEEEHDVSEEAKDLINKLIQIDPKQRLGANVQEKFPSRAAEIRAHPWFANTNWDTLLEDEAQFVPNPENPEDTEYFDSRGATLATFSEEVEDQISPGLGVGQDNNYPDRPHDALFRARSHIASNKRGLMPLHIPRHMARDSRSRRLSEPVIADDFGTFAFRNLPVLERGNKDIIEKMRQDAMIAQARSAGVPQAVTTANTPAPASPAQSLDSSPIPVPVQRALSVNKQHRPASPSILGQASSTASPGRGSQPASPMLVQFSTGFNHERRKTSGSSAGSNLQNSSLYEANPTRPPSVTSSPNKRLSTIVTPAKTTSSGLSVSSPTGRNRSHTVGSQDSETQLKEPFVPGHHKRRSQLFMRDQSPSSSETENTEQRKAVLKLQRKRQSSRRMSQFNIQEGPSYRPLDVLVCEDHPVTRIVMQQLFDKLKCRTVLAESGPQALSYAGGNIEFDIILTEYKLKLIDGNDLARMIRDTKSANTNTPIICATGYLKELPEAHNFDMLVPKPLTIEVLTEALCHFCDWKPPSKDYKLHGGVESLRGLPPPLPQPYDSPSSVASSRAPTMPDSSYKGSSREDSISSGGFFSDLESLKADDQSHIISQTATEDWARGGLGISEDVVQPSHSAFPSLVHAGSEPMPRTALLEEIPFPPPFIRHRPDVEHVRARRGAAERYQGNTLPEEGDDEDEEFGKSNVRQRSPMGGTRGHSRGASKLGHEMMRTNSRGSVISMNTKEDDSSEPDALRKSLEVLQERMGGMTIPEESDSCPVFHRSVTKPRPPHESGRTADRLVGSDEVTMGTSADISPTTTRIDVPTNVLMGAGHITPPIMLPKEPGHIQKDIAVAVTPGGNVDEEATPMPTRTIDFQMDTLDVPDDQPTPRAPRSENGSFYAQETSMTGSPGGKANEQDML